MIPVLPVKFRVDAGFQENSLLSSCSPSETVILVVTLPMSKEAFIANEDKYIQSVAATADVIPENVDVISIDEIASASSRRMAVRLLLSVSVRVQTSVVLAQGQKTSIGDQSALNANLNKSGLPSCSLLVLQTTTSSPLASVTTPAPTASEIFILSTPAPSGVAGSEGSSNILLSAIIGGAGGFLALLAGSFLFFRCGKGNQQQDPQNLTLKGSITLDNLVQY